MATKKRKYQKKKKENIDIKTISLMVFSVLLAVLLFANSGKLGQQLNDVLGGMIGWLRYVLPIGTFAIAIKIACNEKEDEYITQKLTQYEILLICIEVVISVYKISQGNLEAT